jgi:hypothetical protein
VLWVPATFGQAIPLAAGAVIAVPLTLLERRIRLRARRRKQRRS